MTGFCVRARLQSCRNTSISETRAFAAARTQQRKPKIVEQSFGTAKSRALTQGRSGNGETGFHIVSNRLHLLNATMARPPQNPPPKKPAGRRDPVASGERDASVNRSASHNYFLLEKFEAGVALRGTEVKSVRGGRANLKDAYGLVKDGELWLINAHIGPYEHGNIFNHEPLRTRKLLVHRNELNKLIGKSQQKGLTLIPTRLYFRNGRVKVELAVAKGKQNWDKRETERRKTADKEAKEAMARSRRT